MKFRDKGIQVRDKFHRTRNKFESYRFKKSLKLSWNYFNIILKKSILANFNSSLCEIINEWKWSSTARIGFWNCFIRGIYRDHWRRTVFHAVFWALNDKFSIFSAINIQIFAQGHQSWNFCVWAISSSCSVKCIKMMMTKFSRITGGRCTHKLAQFWDIWNSYTNAKKDLKTGGLIRSAIIIFL